MARVQTKYECIDGRIMTDVVCSYIYTSAASISTRPCRQLVTDVYAAVFPIHPFIKLSPTFLSQNVSSLKNSKTFCSTLSPHPIIRIYTKINGTPRHMQALFWFPSSPSFSLYVTVPPPSKGVSSQNSRRKKEKEMPSRHVRCEPAELDRSKSVSRAKLVLLFLLPASPPAPPQMFGLLERLKTVFSRTAGPDAVELVDIRA